MKRGILLTIFLLLIILAIGCEKKEDFEIKDVKYNKEIDRNNLKEQNDIMGETVEDTLEDESIEIVELNIEDRLSKKNKLICEDEEHSGVIVHDIQVFERDESYYAVAFVENKVNVPISLVLSIKFIKGDYEGDNYEYKSAEICFNKIEPNEVIASADYICDKEKSDIPKEFSEIIYTLGGGELDYDVNRSVKAKGVRHGDNLIVAIRNDGEVIEEDINVTAFILKDGEVIDIRENYSLTGRTALYVTHMGDEDEFAPGKSSVYYWNLKRYMAYEYGNEEGVSDTDGYIGDDFFIAVNYQSEDYNGFQETDIMPLEKVNDDIINTKGKDEAIIRSEVNYDIIQEHFITYTDTHEGIEEMFTDIVIVGKNTSNVTLSFYMETKLYNDNDEIISDEYISNAYKAYEIMPGQEFVLSNTYTQGNDNVEDIGEYKYSVIAEPSNKGKMAENISVEAIWQDPLLVLSSYNISDTPVEDVDIDVLFKKDGELVRHIRVPALNKRVRISLPVYERYTDRRNIIGGEAVANLINTRSEELDLSNQFNEYEIYHSSYTDN